MSNDANVRIGEIVFQPGFSRLNSRLKKQYPSERLTKFLNVNPRSKMQILHFCEQYKFVPSNYPLKTLIKSFKPDHQAILNLVKRINSDELSEQDIETINQYIRNIRPKLIKLSKEDIRQINEDLGGETNISKNTKTFVITDVSTHTGFLSTLYADVAELVIEKQLIKQCSECGRFFQKQFKSKLKVFCCDTCSNRQNKRIQYRKKRVMSGN
jgi:Zn finger protein HypA/HybF involved in hydrogenase expression